MKNIIPKVALVHDLSGYGRVSLTEGLPILSAMGIEACPLPTAVLSTHTYKFEDYTFCDLTEEMPKIIDHWKTLGLHFDAIYSGYMGSKKQIEILENFIDDFGKDSLVVVDPVLGDATLCEDGLYSGRMLELTENMKQLVKKADIITPNLTETCLLLDEEYPKGYLNNSQIKEYLEKLSKLGIEKIAITSIMTSENSMCVAVYDKGKYYKVDCGFVNRPFHGTGDVFTSVLTGACLKGYSFIEASDIAVGFCKKAIRETMKHPEMQVENGVLFEPVLAEYFSKKEFETYHIEI